MLYILYIYIYQQVKHKRNTAFLVVLGAEFNAKQRTHTYKIYNFLCL